MEVVAFFARAALIVAGLTFCTHLVKRCNYSPTLFFLVSCIKQIPTKARNGVPIRQLPRLDPQRLFAPNIPHPATIDSVPVPNREALVRNSAVTSQETLPKVRSLNCFPSAQLQALATTRSSLRARKYLFIPIR